MTATENRLGAAAGRGTAAAMAAERGVEGNSVEALLNQFDQIESFNRDVLATNADWQKRQAYEEQLALQAQAINQISSSAPQPVNRPNPLALGLQIAGAGVDGYRLFREFKP